MAVKEKQIAACVLGKFSLANLDKNLDLCCANLLEYGIGNDDIRNAHKWIAENIPIRGFSVVAAWKKDFSLRY